MKLNFEHIRLFISIVEFNGFRAASERLYLSQPAMSSAIKKMEQQLGFALFNRNTYRASLTQHGQAFYHKAKLLLEHMQELENYGDHIAKHDETELALAIDIFCPLDRYLHLFNQLIANYPHTQFQFYTEALGGALERLLEQTVAIAITENLATNVDLEVLQLDKVTMIPVATPEYLQQHRDLLMDPFRIKECAQIIIRDSSQRREKFSFGKLQHARHWTVSDTYSKKQIICSGFGWGRLPDYLIQQELKSGSLLVLQGKNFEQRYLQLSALRLRKMHYGAVSNAVWQALATM